MKHQLKLSTIVASAGFTLVELLVVVTIIVALLAILLPAINGAIGAAQTAVCSSNFHTKHQAFLTYAADRRGALPVFMKGGTWGTYLTGEETPRVLIKYGLKTNDPDNPDQLSGYYTNYNGVADSAWNCPSVDRYMQFYTHNGLLRFNTYPTTNVLTGLSGHPLFFGTHSPSSVRDRLGPIMAETVRSDSTGNPDMPTFHPADVAVHAFSDGYVAAIDAKEFSYDDDGSPTPRLNQWNYGPNLWHWFWSETP